MFFSPYSTCNLTFLILAKYSMLDELLDLYRHFADSKISAFLDNNPAKDRF